MPTTCESHGGGATGSCLPPGIAVTSRRFEFRDLESIPGHWFADNPILTHLENAFSIFIPPGELFFIRSVRAFEDRVRDPELAALIGAFTRQEGHHTRAHDQFNAHLARFGVDVEHETASAERAIARLERLLPRKMRLGATVFLEHLTAVGAHVLLTRPEVGARMHPEALRFWRWHAAEELEHKAVAFDLFCAAGGGYALRMLSAVAAVVLLAVPVHRLFLRMLRADPRPVTDAIREEARALNREIGPEQLRLLGRFFVPGFHPWDLDDGSTLRGWYDEDEAALSTGTARSQEAGC